MVKRAVACAILVGAFACFGGEEANLLANPTFASDGVGGVLNWGFWIPDAAASRATRLPHDGKDGACAIRLRTSRQNYFRQTDVRLVAGETYRFGAWVRTANLGEGHTFELLGWNKGWTAQFGHARLPDDTGGAWQKIEWKGKMVPSPDGTYVLAVVGKSATPDGTADICAPYLEAVGEAARLASHPPAREAPISARIVPVDRLISQIPFAKPELTFYYPGDLEGAAREYDLCGQLDGKGLSPVPLGEDRRALLKLGKPNAGAHELVVSVRERRTGRDLAQNRYPIRVGHHWLVQPKRPRLNNFVEVVTNAPLADGLCRFTLPQATWVWISLEHGAPDTVATLDGFGVPVVRFRPGEPFETMRRLAQGEHTLCVSGVPKAGGRLRVHAVKRIVHCQPNASAAPATPLVPNFAFYHARYGGFYNTAAAYTVYRGLSGVRAWELLAPWLGERGIELQGIVGLTPWAEERKDKARSLAFIRGTQPYRCGLDILVDETSITSTRQSRNSFSEAVWQTIADGDYQAVNVFNNDAVTQLFADPASQATELASIVNSGHGRGMLYPEVYPAALKDMKDAFHWEGHFLDYAKSVASVLPVAADRIVWYFGTFLTVGSWTDWPCPEADVRVLYAHFIHRLATDPAYAPYIGGISAGHFTSSNEDVGRFLAKALRHYCLEGRTDYLPDRYGFAYLPGFVKNADFEEGFTNWTVRAAADGKVEWMKIKNFGRDKQRRKKAPLGTGDCVAVLTRGAQGPNAVAQKVFGLEPGRVYSLAFATVDLDDCLKPHSVEKAFGCRATVEGGTELPALAFERVTGGFSREGAKIERHTTKRIVFRAARPEVTIRISDWASDAAAGAPAGRRTALNYIRFQKYYYEDEADLADLVRAYGEK